MITLGVVILVSVCSNASANKMGSPKLLKASMSGPPKGVGSGTAFKRRTASALAFRQAQRPRPGAHLQAPFWPCCRVSGPHHQVPGEPAPFSIHLVHCAPKQQVLFTWCLDHPTDQKEVRSQCRSKVHASAVSCIDVDTMVVLTALMPFLRRRSQAR